MLLLGGERAQHRASAWMVLVRSRHAADRDSGRSHLGECASAPSPIPMSSAIVPKRSGVIGRFELPFQLHDLSFVTRLLVDPVEGSIESRLATASSTHPVIESSLGAGG